jgi:hypothetical protein
MPPTTHRASGDAAADSVRLEEALVRGPFCVALRLAVRASGLSLDRLQFKLRERGTPVSKTALSYWQHGRNQPERPESMRALSAIEEILGLDSGALAALLGPPRPRGRWLVQKPGALRPDQAWARPDGLARALQRMGSSLDVFHQFAQLGLHLHLSVDSDRRLDSIGHHLVARADVDGVDRKIVAFRSDASTTEPLKITGTRGCRVGRQRHDEPTGFTTFELLLDRPLRAGELAVLHYTVHTSLPDTWHNQRVQQSLRDFSLQVSFAPSVLPARVCRSYRSTVSDSGPVTELSVGASHTAAFAVLDPAPGIHTLAWDWT